MNSNKKTGRIAGVLLLLIFFLGITIFQFLQGAFLFSEDFLIAASENSIKLILSVLLGVLSGTASIFVAIILLPIFKKQHYSLAFLYVAFCILNFITIMIDNYGVISMLEFSKEYVKNTADVSNSLKIMGAVLSQNHWWTHHFYLLISCFPVFVLYYILFVSKLIPRFLSVFGVIAVVLMFIQVLASIFGHSISMDMLLPIALIQLTLPIYLIFKGLKSSELEIVSN